MTLAKVTYKGQVTIPREVRHALGIKDGDSVVFVVEGNRALMMPLPQADLADFFGAFPATRPFPGKKEIRREVKKQVVQDTLKGQG